MIDRHRLPMGTPGRLPGGPGPVWAGDGQRPPARERAAACAARANGGRRWAGRGVGKVLMSLHWAVISVMSDSR